MDKQAEEIMADDTIHAVKVVMSSTHPRTDICDMWSQQDKYGLGPGVYPKEHAPRPPFHPFCRCVLHSKRLIKTDKARENPASERQYLARVMREEGASKAAQIIGGRAKLAAALTNAPIDSIVNINRPAPYRLGRGGDNAGMRSEEFALPAPGVLPRRAAWVGDERVDIVADESAIKKHPHYGEAKTGGTVAAVRLVMDVMDDAWFAANGAKIAASGPVMVGVHAVEGLSTNVIGPMMSQWMGARIGLPVDDNIVQINRVGHTGSSGWH